MSMFKRWSQKKLVLWDILFLRYSRTLKLIDTGGNKLYGCWIISKKWKTQREHRHLILSWRRPISYKNQSTDLLCKSMDWFLYDIGFRHKKVNWYPRVKHQVVKRNQITNRFLKIRNALLVAYDRIIFQLNSVFPPPTAQQHLNIGMLSQVQPSRENINDKSEFYHQLITLSIRGV